MEKSETFLELSKYDTESSEKILLEKITSADLLNAGLPQIFDLLKKKKQYLQNAVSCKAQWSEVSQDEVYLCYW